MEYRDVIEVPIRSATGLRVRTVAGRSLGAAVAEFGVGSDALDAYQSALLDDISALVLRNRGAGPFSVPLLSP